MPRVAKTSEDLILELRGCAQAERLAGMTRFGVDTEYAIGVSMPEIRAIGASTVKSHDLAEELWATGLHEARILASIVDEPRLVTKEQCDRWALDFNSWDIVDQVCGNLIDKTQHANELVHEWSERDEEFVKRASFALIAWMAVHRKKDPDELFLDYLPLIDREADDPRNFVRKAVNWALRQIGKRSAFLHSPAVKLALELASDDDATRRWIGSDAVKELQSDKIRARLSL